MLAKTLLDHLLAQVYGIFGQYQHYLLHQWGQLEAVEGVGHQRETQDGDEGLVHALHSGAAACSHYHSANFARQISAAYSPLGLAKMIRPAAVCNTLVTATSWKAFR